ncbi:MAG: response regulator [Acidobacteria bacterium]|nr:response regulator [Acidobacteriota bacterium]
MSNRGVGRRCRVARFRPPAVDRGAEARGRLCARAADGVRGLEPLNVARPDVGIIDISLPGMGGYQVARRIREEPHGRAMLLLALTGYDSSPDANRPREHGFDHHLVKPVDPEHLACLLSGDRSSFSSAP